MYLLLEWLARGAMRLRVAKDDVVEGLARLFAGQAHVANVVIAVTVIAVVVTLAPFAFIVHVLPLIVMHNAQLAEEIRASDARKQGVALFDSKGRFFGAISGKLESDPDYNPNDEPRRIDGRIIQPDRKAIFVEDPPRGYLECLYELEDSNLGDPLLNPHGNDAGGIARLVISNVRGLVGGKGLNGAGGSTLANMYIQQLVKPKRGNPVFRKINEWRYAPVAKQMLDEDDFRMYGQYAARHLPHVMAVAGERGTVYGIELSSQVLFGKSAEDLSLAEQFVLASSVKGQIAFGDIVNKAGKVLISREMRWNEVIDRANYCVSKPPVFAAVIKSDRVAKAVQEDLALMRRTLPTPRADRRLEALGANRLGAAWADRARDPFRRADIFAFNATRGLRSQLLDRYGLYWSRDVSRVQLTIDIDKDRQFSVPFRSRARALLAARRDLNPNWIDWATYPPNAKEPEQRPEIVAAVADADGRLVHYYSSKELQTYFGRSNPRPAPGRESAWRRYDPAREDRQIASIGKIAAALLLARKDVRPDDVIPDACPGGSGPSAPPDCGGQITVAQAFARSRNDAVEGLLRKVDPSGRETAEVMRSLGWSMASARGAHPAHIASVGLAAASPRTVHQSAGLVLARLTGASEVVKAPSLIGGVRLVDLDRGRMTQWLPGTMALADVEKFAVPGESEAERQRRRKLAPDASEVPFERFLDPGAPQFSGRAAFLRRVLSAPLCEGGTLRNLADLCTRADIDLIFAKTGTLDVSEETNRSDAILSVWIAGGVKFRDGRAFTFVLSMAGTDAKNPLTYRERGTDGQGLLAGDLSPLLRRIVEDLSRLGGN